MLREGIRACARTGALTLLVIAAIAGVAPSSLADATGAIAGTVTEAAPPHGPIAGIQVCAFNRSESVGSEESEEPPCATTGAGGEYTIAGLSSGQYTVGFRASLESHLNYITQYYDGQADEEAADAVAVSAPATTTGIDATLVVGGQISGTVTDASSGGGIEGALVCAELNEGEGNCALSGAGGAYTVPGLASGSYKVFFFRLGYRIQFYDGKASPAEADPVAVVRGETTAGIDAALQPGATVGPPPGSPSSGSGPGPSKTSLPGAKPFAMVRSRRFAVRHHAVAVRLACAHARCVGRIGLLRSIDKGKLHLVKEIALGSFSIAPGHTRTIAMRLVGKKLPPVLANGRHRPVRLDLELSVRGGNTAQERVLVS